MRENESIPAGALLDHWSEAQSKFVKVLPTDYKLALERMQGEVEAAGGVMEVARG